MERVPRDREGHPARPARSRGLTVFGKGTAFGVGAPVVVPEGAGTNSLDFSDADNSMYFPFYLK